jgi:hypothetical protein
LIVAVPSPPKLSQMLVVGIKTLVHEAQFTHDHIQVFGKGRLRDYINLIAIQEKIPPSVRADQAGQSALPLTC